MSCGAISLPCPLNTSVLVLNRSFVAVHVVNVRRAMTLLFRQLAEVVHIEEGQYASYSLDSWREISALWAEFRERDDSEDWIRGVGFKLQAPRVIRLISCDREKVHSWENASRSTGTDFHLWQTRCGD